MNAGRRGPAPSLRSRFAFAFALVGAVVAGLVGVLSYHAAVDRITAEIDRTLASVSAAVAGGQDAVLAVPDGPGADREPGHDPDRDPEQPLLAQAVAADGTATPVGGHPVALPVTDLTRTLAATAMTGRTATARVVIGRDTYRMLTTALGSGRGALQVATDIEQTRRVLGGMAREIAGVSLAVLLAAAAAGWLLARRITRRLVRLARIAGQVSVNGRVDREVPVDGRDEVGRLSVSFNTMLGRLATAREAQDRLVQDAAHELRTPLTSLRTNASVLHRITELSPAARDHLIADVQGETRELSHLVDELVGLALSGGTDEDSEPVDLAAVIRHAADRTRRRTGRQVRVEADHSVVHGRRQALERAINNLLERGQVRRHRQRTPRGAAPPRPAQRRRPRARHRRARRGPRVRPVLPGRHRPRTARLRARAGHRPRRCAGVDGAFGGTVFRTPPSFPLDNQMRNV